MPRAKRTPGQLLAAISGTIPEGPYHIRIYERCTAYTTPVGCWVRWHVRNS